MNKTGRGEVHGDPSGRDLEAAVAEGRSDPLTSLLDGAASEADDGQRRESECDVRLNPNRDTINAEHGGTEHFGQHDPPGSEAAWEKWKVPAARLLASLFQRRPARRRYLAGLIGKFASAYYNGVPLPSKGVRTLLRAAPPAIAIG
jgi:hypothetical protein